MIYSFTPFAGDKNYGDAVNKHCEQVPNGDDWILLRDCDTMFLTKSYPKQIEQAVDSFGNDYDLMGCMTNRLSVKQQLLHGTYNYNGNIDDHGHIAQELAQQPMDVVDSRIVAGMLMLFKKSLWEQVKFRNELIHFDRHFCQGVRAKGYKIGIITSIYIYHQYRGDVENPQSQIDHLR